VAPLSHGAAITLPGGLWTVGGTRATLPGFAPGAVLQAIECEQIDTAVLVPTMIQMLVDHSEAASRDLSSLRLLAYGASPINEALLEGALALLPNTQFMQGYGMTNWRRWSPCWHPSCTAPSAARAASRARPGCRSPTYSCAWWMPKTPKGTSVRSARSAKSSSRARP
jgi:long-chain acyl-CoA synthetase